MAESPQGETTPTAVPAVWSAVRTLQTRRPPGCVHRLPRPDGGGVVTWWEKAKCGLPDAESMTDDGRLNSAEIVARQDVCRGCEVVPDCAKYALSQPTSWLIGVYAGVYVPTTPGPQRGHSIRQLRRKAGAAWHS